ncbi:hypothetical protein MRX96_028001 [Rhipicephalus microplus]
MLLLARFCIGLVHVKNLGHPYWVPPAKVSQYHYSARGTRKNPLTCFQCEGWGRYISQSPSRPRPGRRENGRDRRW